MQAGRGKVWNLFVKGWKHPWNEIFPSTSKDKSSGRKNTCQPLSSVLELRENVVESEA